MQQLEFDIATTGSAPPLYWLERLPAMAHSIDGEGRLVFVNDRWLAALGYRRDDVIGRFVTDFMTADSRLRVQRDVQPAFFRDGRCEDIEYQLIGNDGRVIDVSVSSVLVSAPGAPMRSLSIVRDVTAQRTAERRLAASERLYRRMVEDQSEYVSLATAEGVLLFVNAAQARLHGVTAEALVGRQFLDFVPEEQRASVAAVLAAVTLNGETRQSENQVRLPSGEIRWVRWTNSPTRPEEDGPVLIHSVGRDIQAQVDAEQKLHESEARYRLLADTSEDMIVRLDKDLVRTYVSPASTAMLGFTPEELIGRRTADRAHPEDAPRLRAALKSIFEGRIERHSMVSRRRHRDGRWIWIETNFRALLDPTTGRATDIVGVVRDVTARQVIQDQLTDAYRRLEVLAGQDGLTGLANRRTFDQMLLQHQKRAGRGRQGMALVMIDVDFFKAYNDRYGHPAGDDCLIRVARAIRDTLFEPNELAVRFGGEEFAVLTPAVEEPGARVIGERIREAVQSLAIPHESSPFGVVTVSVGVAAATPAVFAVDRTALLSQADQALYAAKAHGRNRVETAPPTDLRIAVAF